MKKYSTFLLLCLIITSCTTPNIRLESASRTSKNILTDDNYFYHQGTSYQYIGAGVDKLEELTKNIPEAQLEVVECRRSDNNYRNYYLGGIILSGISLVTLSIKLNKPDYKYDSYAGRYVEQDKSSFDVLYWSCFGGSFIFGLLGDNEKSKAGSHGRRAILFYNENISNSIKKESMKSNIPISSTTDIVYLKSGAKFEGKIIENIKGEYIKIRLPNNTILSFDYEQVEKLETIIK